MAVNLLTPILSTRTRSINFFNGRLLAGEDLTTEQQSNRIAHTLLGQAAGAGVVSGLEVAVSARSNTPSAPVLIVTQGLAINSNGTALLLDNDTEVGLVRPLDGTATSTNAGFQDCIPADTGTYLAGAGVYLFTVGPANSNQGLAQTSGTSSGSASCNSNYNAQGVQFRLIPIDSKLLGLENLDDVSHLRNQIAYQCFGASDWVAWRDNPFDLEGDQYGVLDLLRSKQLLTNCEVPLATIFWTADGIQFIDMWAARRRVVKPPASSDWPLFISDRRVSEGEAMLLQFQDQVRDIRNAESNLAEVAAGDRFVYLPPVGFLPTTGLGGASGFDYLTFFRDQAYHDPVFIEATLIQPIVRMALTYDPVNLGNREAVRLYQIVDGDNVLPYLVFTSIFVPLEGESRYDVSGWDFSNFA